MPTATEFHPQKNRDSKVGGDQSKEPLQSVCMQPVHQRIDRSKQQSVKSCRFFSSVFWGRLSASISLNLSSPTTPLKKVTSVLGKVLLLFKIGTSNSPKALSQIPSFPPPFFFFFFVFLLHFFLFLFLLFNPFLFIEFFLY